MKHAIQLLRDHRAREGVFISQNEAYLKLSMDEGTKASLRERILFQQELIDDITDVLEELGVE